MSVLADVKFAEFFVFVCLSSKVIVNILVPVSVLLVVVRVILGFSDMFEKSRVDCSSEGPSFDRDTSVEMREVCGCGTRIWADAVIFWE